MKIPMRVPHRYEGACPLCGTRLLVLAPEPVTEEMRYCSRCRESGLIGQAITQIDPATLGEAVYPAA